MEKPDYTVLWLDNGRNPHTYFDQPLKSAVHARVLAYYTDHIFCRYNTHFVWVKNLQEFRQYIEANPMPDMISFDHDLTVTKAHPEPDGRAVARWLTDYCKATAQPLPPCYIHSSNKARTPELKIILGID